MYKFLSTISRSRHYLNSFTRSYKRVAQNQKYNLLSSHGEARTKSQTSVPPVRPLPVKKNASDSSVTQNNNRVNSLSDLSRKYSQPMLMQKRSKPKIRFVTYCTNPRRLFYSSLVSCTKYGTYSSRKKPFINREALELYRNAIKQCNRIKWRKRLQNTVYQPRALPKVSDFEEDRELPLHVSEVECKTKADRRAKKKINVMPLHVNRDPSPKLKIKTKKSNVKVPAIHKLEHRVVIKKDKKKVKKAIPHKINEIIRLKNVIKPKSLEPKVVTKSQPSTSSTERVSPTTLNIFKKTEVKKHKEKRKMNQKIFNNIIRQKPPKIINLKGQPGVSYRYVLDDKKRTKENIAFKVKKSYEKKSRKNMSITYPANSFIKIFVPRKKLDTKTCQNSNSYLDRLVSQRKLEAEQETKSEIDSQYDGIGLETKGDRIRNHPTLQKTSKEDRMKLTKTYMKLLSHPKSINRISEILNRGQESLTPPKELQENEEKEEKMVEDPLEEPDIIIITDDVKPKMVESKILKHPTVVEHTEENDDIKVKYPKKVLPERMSTYDIEETCIKNNSSKTTVMDNYIPIRQIEEEKKEKTVELKPRQIKISQNTATQDKMFLEKIDTEIEKAYEENIEQNKKHDRPALFKQLLKQYEKLDKEVTSKLKERNAAASSLDRYMKSGTIRPDTSKSASLDRRTKPTQEFTNKNRQDRKEMKKDHPSESGRRSKAAQGFTYKREDVSVDEKEVQTEMEEQEPDKYERFSSQDRRAKVAQQDIYKREQNVSIDRKEAQKETEAEESNEYDRPSSQDRRTKAALKLTYKRRQGDSKDRIETQKEMEEQEANEYDRFSSQGIGIKAAQEFKYKRRQDDSKDRIEAHKETKEEESNEYDRSSSQDRRTKVPQKFTYQRRQDVAMDRKATLKDSKAEPDEESTPYPSEIDNEEVKKHLKSLKNTEDIKWPKLTSEEKSMYEDLLTKIKVEGTGPATCQEAAEPKTVPTKPPLHEKDEEVKKKDENFPKAEDLEETIAGEIKANIMRINEKKGYIPGHIHPSELETVPQKDQEKKWQEKKLAAPKIVWPKREDIEKNFSREFKEKVAKEVQTRAKVDGKQKKDESSSQMDNDTLKVQNSPQLIEAGMANMNALKKITQSCFTEIHKVLSDKKPENSTAEIKKSIKELRKQQVIEDKDKGAKKQDVPVEKKVLSDVKKPKQKYKEPMCNYSMKIVQVENVGLKLFKESINKLKDCLIENVQKNAEPSVASDPLEKISTKPEEIKSTEQLANKSVSDTSIKKKDEMFDYLLDRKPDTLKSNKSGTQLGKEKFQISNVTKQGKQQIVKPAEPSRKKSASDMNAHKKEDQIFRSLLEKKAETLQSNKSGMQLSKEKVQTSEVTSKEAPQTVKPAEQSRQKSASEVNLNKKRDKIFSHLLEKKPEPLKSNKSETQLKSVSKEQFQTANNIKQQFEGSKIVNPPEVKKTEPKSTKSDSNIFTRLAGNVNKSTSASKVASSGSKTCLRKERPKQQRKKMDLKKAADKKKELAKLVVSRNKNVSKKTSENKGILSSSTTSKIDEPKSKTKVETKKKEDLSPIARLLSRTEVTKQSKKENKLSETSSTSKIDHQSNAKADQEVEVKKSTSATEVSKKSSTGKVQDTQMKTTQATNKLKDTKSKSHSNIRQAKVEESDQKLEAKKATSTTEVLKKLSTSKIQEAKKEITVQAKMSKASDKLKDSKSKNQSNLTQAKAEGSHQTPEAKKSTSTTEVSKKLSTGKVQDTKDKIKTSSKIHRSNTKTDQKLEAKKSASTTEVSKKLSTSKVQEAKKGTTEQKQMTKANNKLKDMKSESHSHLMQAKAKEPEPKLEAKKSTSTTEVSKKMSTSKVEETKGKMKVSCKIDQSNAKTDKKVQAKKSSSTTEVSKKSSTREVQETKDKMKASSKIDTSNAITDKKTEANKSTSTTEVLKKSSTSKVEETKGKMKASSKIDLSNAKTDKKVQAKKSSSITEVSKKSSTREVQETKDKMKASSKMDTSNAITDKKTEANKSTSTTEVSKKSSTGNVHETQMKTQATNKLKDTKSKSHSNIRQAKVEESNQKLEAKKSTSATDVSKKMSTRNVQETKKDSTEQTKTKAEETFKDISHKMLENKQILTNIQNKNSKCDNNKIVATCLKDYAHASDLPRDGNVTKSSLSKGKVIDPSSKVAANKQNESKTQSGQSQKTEKETQSTNKHHSNLRTGSNVTPNKNIRPKTEERTNRPHLDLKMGQQTSNKDPNSAQKQNARPKTQSEIFRKLVSQNESFGKKHEAKKVPSPSPQIIQGPNKQTESKMPSNFLQKKPSEAVKPLIPPSKNTHEHFTPKKPFKIHDPPKKPEPKKPCSLLSQRKLLKELNTGLTGSKTNSTTEKDISNKSSTPNRQLSALPTKVTTEKSSKNLNGPLEAPGIILAMNELKSTSSWSETPMATQGVSPNKEGTSKTEIPQTPEVQKEDFIQEGKIASSSKPEHKEKTVEMKTGSLDVKKDTKNIETSSKNLETPLKAMGTTEIPPKERIRFEVLNELKSIHNRKKIPQHSQGESSVKQQEVQSSEEKRKMQNESKEKVVSSLKSTTTVPKSPSKMTKEGSEKALLDSSATQVSPKEETKVQNTKDAKPTSSKQELVKKASSQEGLKKSKDAVSKTNIQKGTASAQQNISIVSSKSLDKIKMQNVAKTTELPLQSQAVSSSKQKAAVLDSSHKDEEKIKKELSPMRQDQQMPPLEAKVSSQVSPKEKLKLQNNKDVKLTSSKQELTKKTTSQEDLKQNKTGKAVSSSKSEEKINIQNVAKKIETPKETPLKAIETPEISPKERIRFEVLNELKSIHNRKETQQHSQGESSAKQQEVQSSEEKKKMENEYKEKVVSSLKSAARVPQSPSKMTKEGSEKSLLDKSSTQVSPKEETKVQNTKDAKPTSSKQELVKKASSQEDLKKSKDAVSKTNVQKGAASVQQNINVVSSKSSDKIKMQNVVKTTDLPLQSQAVSSSKSKAAVLDSSHKDEDKIKKELSSMKQDQQIPPLEAKVSSQVSPEEKMKLQNNKDVKLTSSKQELTKRTTSQEDLKQNKTGKAVSSSKSEEKINIQNVAKKTETPQQIKGISRSKSHAVVTSQKSSGKVVSSSKSKAEVLNRHRRDESTIKKEPLSVKQEQQIPPLASSQALPKERPKLQDSKDLELITSKQELIKKAPSKDDLNQKVTISKTDIQKGERNTNEDIHAVKSPKTSVVPRRTRSVSPIKNHEVFIEIAEKVSKSSVRRSSEKRRKVQTEFKGEGEALKNLSPETKASSKERPKPQDNNRELNNTSSKQELSKETPSQQNNLKQNKDTPDAASMLPKAEPPIVKKEIVLNKEDVDPKNAGNKQYLPPPPKQPPPNKNEKDKKERPKSKKDLVLPPRSNKMDSVVPEEPKQDPTRKDKGKDDKPEISAADKTETKQDDGVFSFLPALNYKKIGEEVCRKAKEYFTSFTKIPAEEEKVSTGAKRSPIIEKLIEKEIAEQRNTWKPPPGRIKESESVDLESLTNDVKTFSKDQGIGVTQDVGEDGAKKAEHHDAEFLKKLRQRKYHESSRTLEDFEKSASFNIKFGGRFEVKSDTALARRIGNLDTDFRIPQYSGKPDCWWSKCEEKVGSSRNLPKFENKEVKQTTDSSKEEKENLSKCSAVFIIKPSGSYELVQTKDIKTFTEPTEAVFKKKLKNARTEPKINKKTTSRYCLDNFRGEVSTKKAKSSVVVKKPKPKHLLEDYKGDVQSPVIEPPKVLKIKKNEDIFKELGNKRNIDKKLQAKVCEIFTLPRKITKREKSPPILDIRSDFSILSTNSHQFPLFIQEKRFSEKAKIIKIYKNTSIDEIMLDIQREKAYGKFNKKLEREINKKDLFSGTKQARKVAEKNREEHKKTVSGTRIKYKKEEMATTSTEPEPHIKRAQSLPLLIVHIVLPKADIPDHLKTRVEELKKANKILETTPDSKELKVLHKPKQKTPRKNTYQQQKPRKILSTKNETVNRKSKHTKSSSDPPKVTTHRTKDSDSFKGYMSRKQRIMQTYAEQAKIVPPSIMSEKDIQNEPKARSVQIFDPRSYGMHLQAHSNVLIRKNDKTDQKKPPPPPGNSSQRYLSQITDEFKHKKPKEEKKPDAKDQEKIKSEMKLRKLDLQNQISSIRQQIKSEAHLKRVASKDARNSKETTKNEFKQKQQSKDNNPGEEKKQSEMKLAKIEEFKQKKHIEENKTEAKEDKKKSEIKLRKLDVQKQLSSIKQQIKSEAQIRQAASKQSRSTMETNKTAAQRPVSAINVSDNLRKSSTVLENNPKFPKESKSKLKQVKDTIKLILYGRNAMIEMKTPEETDANKEEAVNVNIPKKEVEKPIKNLEEVEKPVENPKEYLKNQTAFPRVTKSASDISKLCLPNKPITKSVEPDPLELKCTYDVPIGDKITVPKYQFDPLAKYRHLKITYIKLKKRENAEREDLPVLSLKQPHFESKNKKNLGKSLSEEDIKVLALRFEILKRLHEEFSKNTMAKINKSRTLDSEEEKKKPTSKGKGRKHPKKGVLKPGDKPNDTKPHARRMSTSPCRSQICGNDGDECKNGGTESKNEVMETKNEECKNEGNECKNEGNESKSEVIACKNEGNECKNERNEGSESKNEENESKNEVIACQNAQLENKNEVIECKNEDGNEGKNESTNEDGTAKEEQVSAAPEKADFDIEKEAPQVFQEPSEGLMQHLGENYRNHLYYKYGPESYYEMYSFLSKMRTFSKENGPKEDGGDKKDAR